MADRKDKAIFAWPYVLSAPPFRALMVINKGGRGVGCRYMLRLG